MGKATYCVHAVDQTLDGVALVFDDEDDWSQLVAYDRAYAALGIDQNSSQINHLLSSWTVSWKEPITRLVSASRAWCRNKTLPSPVNKTVRLLPNSCDARAAPIEAPNA